MEDALDQAHLVRFLLEETGEFRVTHVQDGVRGSELAEAEDWALVITDLNLPGAYGMAVIEASRKAHPETPILATTAYSGPEFAERARKQEVDDVLIKPLDRDDLLARVRKLVGIEVPGGDRPRDTEAEKVEGPTGVEEATEFEEATETEEATTTEAEVPVKPGPSRSDLALQVLAVGIRPGELEAGCAGTLLRHISRGDRVVALVLSRGSEEGHDLARQAGRVLGARSFIGVADPDDIELFTRQITGALSGAVDELRPDVIYAPTGNRRDPLGSIVVEAVLEQAADVPRIFCYDAGDPTPDFRPTVFVPVTSVLETKLDVLRIFDAPVESPLNPNQALTAARFWARFLDGRPGEALESLRGDAPWEGHLEEG
ncbi:MAG: response regulator [Gemmatimonadota bacterium]